MRFTFPKKYDSDTTQTQSRINKPTDNNLGISYEQLLENEQKLNLKIRQLERKSPVIYQPESPQGTQAEFHSTTAQAFYPRIYFQPSPSPTHSHHPSHATKPEHLSDNSSERLLTGCPPKTPNSEPYVSSSAYSMYAMASTQDQYSRLEKKTKALTKENSRLLSVVSESTRDRDRQQTRLQKLESELASFKQKFLHEHTKSTALADANEKNSALQEQISLLERSLENEKASSSQQISALREKLQTSKRKKKDARKEISRILEEKERASKAQKEQENVLAKASANEQRLIRRIAELEAESENLEREKERAETIIQVAEMAFEAVPEDLDGFISLFAVSDSNVKKSKVPDESCRNCQLPQEALLVTTSQISLSDLFLRKCEKIACLFLKEKKARNEEKEALEKERHKSDAKEIFSKIEMPKVRDDLCKVAPQSVSVDGEKGEKMMVELSDLMLEAAKSILRIVAARKQVKNGKKMFRRKNGEQSENVSSKEGTTRSEESSECGSLRAGLKAVLDGVMQRVEGIRKAIQVDDGK